MNEATDEGGSARASRCTGNLRMRDLGWCWDGQGFNGGVNPSIFGVGEGTRWFGLAKVCYMFHPNTDLALQKLSGFAEVVCEISKWKVRRVENGVAHYLDGSLETKRSEAALVSRLSTTHRNITGAVDDDLLAAIKREGITPDQYAGVYEALKNDNPGLQLWAVVYSRELVRRDWDGFEPYMDIINLCVGDVADFMNLETYLDACEALFPGKPVNLVYRLRDFRHGTSGCIAMPVLQSQWELLRSTIRDGRLSGYSILGGFLIDMHPQQAKWLRDFIAGE